MTRQVGIPPINPHTLFHIFLSFFLAFFIHYKRPEARAISYILFFLGILFGLVILDKFATRINARVVTSLGTGISGLGYILYKFGMTKLDGYILGIGSSIIASIWFYHLIENRIGNLTILGNEDGSVRHFLELVANQKNGMTKFRVMDTWTELTTEQYHKKFEIALTIKNDLSIKMLLANPFANIIRQREDDIGYDIQHIAQEGILRLYNLRENNPRLNLHVRLYSTTVSCRSYSSEIKTLFSFYPPGMKADEVPCLEFFSNSPLGKYVLQHFQTVWDSQKTIELYQHMKLRLTPPDTYNVMKHENWSREYLFCTSTNQYRSLGNLGQGNNCTLLIFVSDGGIRSALTSKLKDHPIDILIDPMILEAYGYDGLFNQTEYNCNAGDKRVTIRRKLKAVDENKVGYWTEDKIQIQRLFEEKYGKSNADVARFSDEPTIFLASVKLEESW